MSRSVPDVECVGCGKSEFSLPNPIGDGRVCRPCYHHGRRYGSFHKSIARRGAKMEYLVQSLLTDADSNLDDPCHFWPFPRHKAGYGQINVNGKNKYVHRLVLQMHGRNMEALEARHKCRGAKQGCMLIGHLEPGTTKDNKDDQERDGTAIWGQRVGSAKLTTDQVREVLASNESAANLADRLPVSADQIRNIRRGKQWKKLPR